MPLLVDLNCDLGEGLTGDSAERDRELMSHISSCSIACGGHAGSADSMQRTVDAALQAQLRLGAHPSYPDRAKFGRVSIPMPLPALCASITEQVVALTEIIEVAGGKLRFVKPHGALYNDMAQDSSLASAVLQTIKAIDPSLSVMGLAGSLVGNLSQDLGVGFIGEAFADRRYLDNGHLAPRSEVGAVIHDSAEAVEQIISIVQRCEITSITGRLLSLHADTICVHGDTPGALSHLEHISAALKDAGFTVCAPQ